MCQAKSFEEINIMTQAILKFCNTNQLFKTVTMLGGCSKLEMQEILLFVFDCEIEKVLRVETDHC